MSSIHPRSGPHTAMTNHFFWKKLHGLSGVAPVGVFLVYHLWVNANVVRGPAAYDSAVKSLRQIPFLWAFELLFIVGPLLFHALYGFGIMWFARNNVWQYGYFRNWMYYLQRVTGVVAFLFIAYHYYAFRLSNALFGRPVSFATAAHDLANPWIFWIYLIGVTLTVFHFVSGLWYFAVDWGILIGPRAQRLASYWLGGVFLLLAWLGLTIVLTFHGSAS